MKSQPIHQKPLELFIHVIAWLLVFGFPLILTDRSNSINWEQYLRHCIAPLSFLIIFYANYSFLVPRYLFNGNTKRFFLYNTILLVVLWICVYGGREMWVAHPPRIHPPHFAPPPRWVFYTRDLVVMIFVAGLSTAIRVSMQWHQMQDKLVAIEREKTEAELNNLKNQLNPHFLLNTLNNIYALITFDSEKAQQAVHELSKLLRYMLYDNQSSLVPLEKEIDFINNYVSLMRIRVSKSVEVSIHLDAGPKQLFISPFIFISLIENAFKHGISPTEESFISISIQGQEDGKVCCAIMNSNYPKTTADKSGSGIGLEQVSRRLELLYPGRYEWNRGVNDNGTSYTSILTIQTEESCN
ncbi:MAG: histidine kinase [Bacteroidaceae bacterium]|nr:histidine kinase [Bacteroidaceae bacterium]